MKPGSPEAVKAADAHLRVVAKLLDDDILVYIGIGAHGKKGKDIANIDYKVLGANRRAAALGQKLLDMSLPMMDDFLHNDLLQWIEDNQELFNEDPKDLSESPKA